MLDQELKLTAKLEGAYEVADGLGKIQDAQSGVTSSTQEGAAAADMGDEAFLRLLLSGQALEGGLKDADQAIKGLTDSQRNLLRTLVLTVPGFRQYGFIARAVFLALNDAGKAQLTFGGIVEKATGVLQANISAMKLMGAVGAAIAAISLLVKTYQALQQAAKAATDAINAEAAATAKARGEHISDAEALRDAANERTRMAPMGVEEAAAAETRAKRIAEKYPTVDIDLARKVQIAYAGAGLTPEELEGLTLAYETKRGLAFPRPGESDAARAARAARIRKQEAPAMGLGAQHAADERRKELEELAAQVRGGEGEAAAAFAAKYGGTPEEQARRLKIWQEAGGVEAGLKPSAGMFGWLFGKPINIPVPGGGEPISRHELAQAIQGLRDLALEERAERRARGSVGIQYNVGSFGPDGWRRGNSAVETVRVGEGR